MGKPRHDSERVVDATIAAELGRVQAMFVAYHLSTLAGFALDHYRQQSSTNGMREEHGDMSGQLWTLPCAVFV